MFSILVYKFNILPIHSQFAKRFESLLKKFLAFENYELQNCRRHLPTLFCSGPNSLGSVFNEKKLIILKKSEKIVTLINYFMHRCPYFY